MKGVNGNCKEFIPEVMTTEIVFKIDKGHRCLDPAMHCVKIYFCVTNHPRAPWIKPPPFISITVL